MAVLAENTSADGTTNVILDAARAAVLEFGVRRATLSDVARRAGVSRMTVYNRFDEKSTLMRALMTREFSALLERVAADVDGQHARARLVASLVLVARALPADELFRKVRRAEPELLAPYVFERLGETQQVGLELAEQAICEGQRDGSIRAGRPRAIAATLLLIEQSFVFSAATIPGVGRGQLLAELEIALHAALSPVAPDAALSPAARRG